MDYFVMMVITLFILLVIFEVKKRQTKDEVLVVWDYFPGFAIGVMLAPFTLLILTAIGIFMLCHAGAKRLATKLVKDDES